MGRERLRFEQAGGSGPISQGKRKAVPEGLAHRRSGAIVLDVSCAEESCSSLRTFTAQDRALIDASILACFGTADRAWAATKHRCNCDACFLCYLRIS